MASVMALLMIRKVQLSPLIVIEISPQATTVEVGDFFNVSVDISDANDIDAFQFVLMYDPNILSAIAVGLLDEPDPLALIDGELTGVPTVWNGYDCDVVPDGVLDIYDFVAWREACFSVPGDPNWNPRADINNSGGVDIDDFYIWRDAWWDTYVDSPGTIWFMWYPNGAWAGGLFANVLFEAIHCCCCNTPLDLDDVKLSFMGAPVPYQIIDGTVFVTFISDIRGPESPPGSGLYPPDGVVDGWDYNFIGLHFGHTSASPCWSICYICDTRGPGPGNPPDGVIDGWDYNYAGLHFGSSCP